jgi:magnesium transporter
MEHLEKLIDSLHLKDLRNEAHPSLFDENEGYDMLILRLPVIAQTLTMKSWGFVITPRGSYFYDPVKEGFEALDDRFNAPYQILDKAADQLLKSFVQYQDLIEDMEEFLYEDKTPREFMRTWMDLKRDILRIERVLLRASVTMKNLIDYYEKTEQFPLNHYIDITEHLERTMHSCTLQMSKLDYLYSFHRARTNERMNTLITTLTIISAIFLPLNLIVGFFGMNTSGLPFSQGSSGTLYAFFLMLSLILLSGAVLYFWKRKTERS